MSTAEVTWPSLPIDTDSYMAWLKELGITDPRPPSGLVLVFQFMATGSPWRTRSVD